MIGLMEREQGMSTTGAEPSQRNSKLRFVMADDSYADQQLMLRAIQRVGLDASLIFLNDGYWLIRYLKGLDPATIPDLIMLDLRMPRFDGFQVLDELQSHPVLMQVPVLVLTAATGLGDRRRAHSSGATYFNRKPATFEELVALAGSLPRLVRGSDFDSD